MAKQTHHRMTKRDPAYRDRYGPVAVVTGASDGIGQAFARDLAARGLDLVVVARRADRLRALADELTAAHGIAVTVVDTDLGRPAGVARVVEATADLDVGLLVAAAGFGTSGRLLDQPLAAELDMIDVNCRSVVALTHPIGRRLVRRGRGGIVLMSSLVAFQGVPRAANYAATKAFIQSLAEGLRTELKAHGVDVVASAPGPIASGFAARANMQMGMSQPPAVVSRQTLDALGRKTTVRPGWLVKLLEAGLMLLPRRGRVLVLTQVMKGMARGAADRTDTPAEQARA